MKKTSNARGKGTMADMRALSMSLAEVVGDGGVGLATTAKRSKTPTARRRAALVSKETTRMQAVLSHPTFRSNPIAAISNHIISDVANASGSAASGRSSEDKGKKKRAKKLTPRQERDRSGAHVVGPAGPTSSDPRRRARVDGRTTRRGNTTRKNAGEREIVCARSARM